jgi:hypothetical protein
MAANLESSLSLCSFEGLADHIYGTNVCIYITWYGPIWIECLEA